MVWQQIHEPLSSMIKSTVVTSTAPRWFTREGDVPRDSYFYSVALACVLGLYVAMQAPVWPFTLMVVHGSSAAKVFC